MRLVNIEPETGDLVPAVQRGDGSVVLLPSLLGAKAPATIAKALERQADIRNALATYVTSTEATAEASGTAVLRAPCDNGVLLVLAGSNYRSHVAEMNSEGKVASKATSFVKSPSAVIGSGQDIVIPEQFPNMVDFEGEVCVVFDRTCHHVSVADAMDYVGGYTILNDVSARDSIPAMLAATTPPAAQDAMLTMMMQKHLPTFAPLGPAIVTADEIHDPANLRMITRVNGEVMQDAVTADLVLDIPHLIAEMSQYYLFRPGDILSTGTPAGVGFSRNPQVFLHPGDTVSVEVTGLGTLENKVRASGN